MSVLKRNMFKGGGFAHRGTGITTGLVRGYSNGGDIYRAGAYNPTLDQLAKKNMLANIKNTEVDEKEPFQLGSGSSKEEDLISAMINYPMYRELFAATLPEREKPSKYELLAPSAMTFFGNLMSGKSYQSGAGGALEIAGEALQKTAPQLSEAMKMKKGLEQAARQEEAQVSQMALQKALETTAPGTIKDIPINLFNQMSRTEQEKILGIGPEHKDEPTVKGIPKSIFDALPANEQSIILGTAPAPTNEAVKGIPRDVYDELSQPAKNKILGITDEPVIIKGVPEYIFNKLSPDDQNKLLGLTPIDPKEETVKGIPLSIYNKFNEEDQRAIALGSTKEQTVKGIPLSLFETFSTEDKNTLLGLVPEAKNHKITEVDGNMVATWTVGDKLEQKVIGSAPPPDKDDLTEFEGSVEAMQDLLGDPKERWKNLDDTYGFISKDSDVITQEDIDYIKERMLTDFAMLKSTEKEGLSLQEQKNLARAENIMKTIESPLMTKISDAAEFSQNRQKVYQPILSSLDTFKPGAFADLRMTLGKWVDLLGPEQLGPGMRELMTALKIGNPVAADIFATMSSKLTLSNAQGGALPGNLNLKEFEELQRAGIPLWTTEKGARVLTEIFKREDNINLAANEMMGQLVGQQERGALGRYTIKLPNGDVKEFNSFTTALQYIDRFIDTETSTLVSGSDIMGTESLSNDVAGLGRYDEETLKLDGKLIAWPDKVKGEQTIDAAEAFEDGKLQFVGFADQDAPDGSQIKRVLDDNPTWVNKAVYMYDTGELWTEDDQYFDPNKNKVGDRKLMYWAPD
tara:strand:- start:199 stop:2598 length:2400 start_codon:yes stop_codon:yes gene_type:complete